MLLDNKTQVRKKLILKKFDRIKIRTELGLKDKGLESPPPLSLNQVNFVIF